MRSEEPAVDRMEQRRKSFNITSWENTFASFKEVPGTERSLAAFKALASGKTKWKMLLSYGGVGNGKTHLAEATVIELNAQGNFCRLLTFNKIIGTLKNSFDPRPGFRRYEDLLRDYCNMEYLIIDDIGIAGSDSDWSFDRLEEIVVHRYQENLFTILVTNLDYKKLPERVWDRFRDKSKARMVENKAESYRGKVK